MAARLTRIYTRRGDKGTTTLAEGRTVSKHSARIEAIGTVDELNSQLGLLLAELQDDPVLQSLLQPLQHDLFDLGGELAMVDADYQVITAELISELERQLDRLNADLPPLQEFILPGGSRAAAQCHVVRCVCRRAERCLAALAAEEYVNPQASAYLNRLSDLLFVCCRHIARHQGREEILWQPRHQRR